MTYLFKEKIVAVIRSYIVVLLVCVVIFKSYPQAVAQSPVTAEPRPNILLIVTDDQAAWAVGDSVKRGWYTDIPPADTPNLDQLASQGVTLRNMFCTTPTCSPSRAVLMTGRYASEFGIYDFIPQPGHVLFNPDKQVRLDPDACQTFAEVLRADGYRTGLIGKWHLGDWTQSGGERFHPTHFGWEYFMGLTGGGTFAKDPELEEDGDVTVVEGFTSDILVDRAIRYMRRTDDRPFLLMVSTRAPHTPYLPVPDEVWSRYKTSDPKTPQAPDLDVTSIKKRMRAYLASVNALDASIGHLLDEIDRLGISHNTVVIFTSDHGYNMGHNGIWHKGNGIWAIEGPVGESRNDVRNVSDKYRPNMYDLSLRVPAIVRWPGVVEPGTVIEDTTTLLDIYPTVIEAANATHPQEATPNARSLVPLLRNEPHDDWDQDLYAEYSMLNYVVAHMRCYRTPRYKLIRDYHNAGRDEFYDLMADPDENVNLIHNQNPAIQAQVRALDDKIRSRMRALGDPLLQTAVSHHTR